MIEDYSDPPEHRTWLAESTRDGAWQSVCEGCHWQSRWVHFDEFDETDDPAQSAADHAAELGRQHAADNTEDEDDQDGLDGSRALYESPDDPTWS